jgi:hypothetical protein
MLDFSFCFSECIWDFVPNFFWDCKHTSVEYYIFFKKKLDTYSLNFEKWHHGSHNKLKSTCMSYSFRDIQRVNCNLPFGNELV